jgi:hypothetical protein
MECPGGDARQIGDMYQRTLDVLSLKNYYAKCSLQGHVFCNAIKNASGMEPTLRIETA